MLCYLILMMKRFSMLVTMPLIDGPAEAGMFHSSMMSWFSSAEQQRNGSEFSKLSEHGLYEFL